MGHFLETSQILGQNMGQTSPWVQIFGIFNPIYSEVNKK